MPVLFFRRCFLRLECGEGGGSSLGLVALPALEPAGSLVPLAGEKEKNVHIEICPRSFHISNHIMKNESRDVRMMSWEKLVRLNECT